MALLSRAALVLLLAACALGGGSGGGDDALPVAGTGPFAKLSDPSGQTPLFEPFVVVDALASISDPAPLVLGDGTLRIYFARAAAEIRRVDLSPSLAEVASDPVTVLMPTVAEGKAAAPSVVRRGGEILLYYETDAGIALARSADEGATFTRDRLVADGGRSPGAVVIDDGVILYFSRAGDPGIWAATSDDGVVFTGVADPVVLPSGADWDIQGLADPSPSGGRSAAGAIHIGLTFAGTGKDGTTAIGYAGSADGIRFESLPAPILEAGAPSERGPAAIATPARVILLFTQDRSGKLAIGAATEP